MFTHTHLWGYHGANFSKDHMTRQGKKNVVAECCEPHHPFKISHILQSKKKRYKEVIINQLT